MTDARLERLLGYWQIRLASLPAVHRWPTDRPRPRVRGIEGGRYARRHSREHTDAMQAICREHDVTPFMLMQAIFAVLLSGWSGQRDIAMISPVSTRNRPELAPLIGYFINPVVLRSDCDPGMDFVDFLRVTKKTILDAHEHRHAPFELLVRRLNPARSADHHPLAQVSFMLLQGERASASGAIALPDLTITPLPEAERAAMKFDLELVLRETPEGMVALWGYRSELFDRQTIERLDDDLEALVDRVIAAPNCALSSILGFRPEEFVTMPPQVSELPGGAVQSALARLPQTPEEQWLAALWSELLDESPRHADADFFALGGSSMLAVRLSMRLRDRYRMDMPPRIVFEHPVLREQAEWLRQRQGIDRHAEIPVAVGALDAVEVAPPVSRVNGAYTERTLVEIWASCLELPVDAIGMDDSFFEIGGNSALSIAVQAEIIDTLGVEISIADMFQYPTIRHLARMIDGVGTQRGDRSAALADARLRVHRMRTRSKK
jgi:acyl carrier protein